MHDTTILILAKSLLVLYRAIRSATCFSSRGEAPLGSLLLTFTIHPRQSNKSSSATQYRWHKRGRKQTRKLAHRASAIHGNPGVSRIRPQRWAQRNLGTTVTKPCTPLYFQSPPESSTTGQRSPGVSHQPLSHSTATSLLYRMIHHHLRSSSPPGSLGYHRAC